FHTSTILSVFIFGTRSNEGVCCFSSEVQIPSSVRHILTRRRSFAARSVFRCASSSSRASSTERSSFEFSNRVSNSWIEERKYLRFISVGLYSELNQILFDGKAQRLRGTRG